MSVLGEIEGVALSAAPGFGWVRIALKIAPWVAIAALAVALLLTRGTLERVKLQAKVDVADAKRDAAEASAADARKAADASDKYADRTAALQPLIVRSTDTVRTYAETPAGRVQCLDADRVHGIDELDASLFASPAAGGGAEAVHPDAGAPAAGRNGDQR